MVISDYLADYVRPLLRSKARFEVIPIMVDTDEFSPDFEVCNHEKLAIYAGSLGHAGEVEGLIEAFGIATMNATEWQLLIIGMVTDSLRSNFEAQIGKSRLEGRVKFSGHIARNEMPSILRQAELMLLYRAAGLFSTAGLPTKLGEYLAMGKPVLVTETGDISKYLADGINAYLVPPGDIYKFAEHLQYIVSHPEEAREVGKRGRQIACEQFDYRKAAEKFSFLLSEFR